MNSNEYWKQMAHLMEQQELQIQICQVLYEQRQACVLDWTETGGSLGKCTFIDKRLKEEGARLDLIKKRIKNLCDHGKEGA